MSKDDNYGFKGNAPDNPKINQMISFLYVGVAALNDGVISDNEIIQMVKKHISYGMEKEDAFRLLDESIAWWNDAKGKDVHFEDLVQCAKHIKNHQAWNENLKEMVHIDLTSITLKLPSLALISPVDEMLFEINIFRILNSSLPIS